MRGAHEPSSKTHELSSKGHELSWNAHELSLKAHELQLKAHELSLKKHERSSAPLSVALWRFALLLALLLSAAAPLPAEEIVKRVGRVTFRVDTSQAFPGGVLVVRLGIKGRLGGAWAFLDGHKAPFYPDRGVLRALVPVSTIAEAGAASVGVGIAARGGEQRLVIPVTISAREYPNRNVVVPEEKRLLLDRPDAAHDGRRLLSLVRTETSDLVPGVLLPPVGSTGGGFGEARVHAAATAIESRSDALQGERHRGVDYLVPAGTPVRAPAAGTVLFAGPLTLTGDTLVIDHGQGVVSVLLHLSRIDVRVGDSVAAGAFVGASGQSGLTPEPLLEWRVYLHAVPVDPSALAALL
jgi:murein DD-endopeptidase MepM/ murein hydrolase activator NlpD